MRPLLWLKFFVHFSFWAIVPGEFHMFYALTHQPKIVEPAGAADPQPEPKVELLTAF